MTVLQETTRGTSAKNATASGSGVGYLGMVQVVGFQCDVAGDSVLVCYQAASLRKQFPTFRKNMVTSP
jgi:hypothetical protein